MIDILFKTDIVTFVWTLGCFIWVRGDYFSYMVAVSCII